jgi:hypothetical protein
MSAPYEYGHTCFNCQEQSMPCATQLAAHWMAARAGWVMGHCNGQAHYACDACAVLLFDTIPLSRMKL